MAQGEYWSRLEVEACVADYLEMLTLELNGQHYSKTEHARALLLRLDGRSKQSVEFKHCNISAVMLALGYPYIDGYKPRGNYQGLLLVVVEEQLQSRLTLQDAAQAAASRPATTISSTSGIIQVPAPKPARVRETSAEYTPSFLPIRYDYLAQEARNRSLGRAGELLVLELEARRLHSGGKKALSERVEHVAVTQGDGLGFDVLSFEEDGRERLIEVKTTAFGEMTPIFVSRNELTRSESDAPTYHLYRIFDFRRRTRFFELSGAISGSCSLEPTTYLARVGS